MLDVWRTALHGLSFNSGNSLKSGFEQRPSCLQVQAEQALQSITAAMEQASHHRQEATNLQKQLAQDQVSCSKSRIAAWPAFNIRLLIDLTYAKTLNPFWT